MKKRVWIAALILLFSQAESLAQYASFNGRKPIIVAADEIRDITVAGNVDVVLRQSKTPGTFVNVESKNTGKLKAIVSGEELLLDSKSSAGSDRITVFVYVSDIASITLKDNSYAVSMGVLDLNDLEVNVQDQARVAIRTKDRIRFTSPEDRTLITNEKYYSVVSADR